MATNAYLQNAALAGFLSGANQCLPFSATSADYATICNAAQAFAEQVDSKIALDATLVTPADTVTVAKVNLMTLLCAGVCAGRTILELTPSFYDLAATRVAALYTRAITEIV